MKQRLISLEDVQITVLDEADHMADLGFLPVVKRILEKGLDQQDLLAAFDALASTYTEGGRFYRATNTILQ